MSVLTLLNVPAPSSAVGGLLVPTVNEFLEDQAFDDYVQAYIVGVTGLAGALVRPQLQPDPPDLPPFSTNWASYLVSSADADQYGYSAHSGNSTGQDTFQEHETVEIKTQFYGPHARSYAKQLRGSLKVPQSQEYWRAQNAGLLDTGQVITVPTLLKERWFYRADFMFRLRRQILRTYPILNVVSANGTVTIDNNGKPAAGVTETITAVTTGD
jgi:hypothetical protein